ncbi:MAG: hypothetical protein JWR36_567 [Glaciihabitans sp.]|jgi:hypothetical protein|nr:hypothetical protein [Glaciihabitans sp.]MDQ1572192.1 hypothetical protein [Actinomycetota bacterium]
MASEHRGIEVFGRRRRTQIDEPVRQSSTLGIVAFSAAIVTVFVVAIGVFTAESGKYASATGLAYFAIAASVVAVIGGLLALLLGRGRGWGVAAILIGGLASPLVLTRLLGMFSGLG